MAAWKDVKSKTKTVAYKTKIAAYFLKEKNRRAAVMNRLRMVVRCEERAAEKEYLALGRYYYNALRNADDAIAESHCARIDGINARRDSALENLEQLSREEKASIGVIGGADGPTAVYVSGKKKAPIFHFDHGPVEITVTRDGVYDPEDENSEEVDLSDVECFDSDPTLPRPEEPVEREAGDAADCAAVPGACPVESASRSGGPELRSAEPEFRSAELTENDGLPFE